MNPQQTPFVLVLLSTIHRTIDRVIEFLGRRVAWAALLTVLVMVVIVMLRYFFNFGSIAMQESILYLNTLLLALGIAHTLKEKGHVRVDIFYSRFSSRRRDVVDIIGTLAFLLPSMGAVVYFSWDYVAASWRVGEGSTEASGLPYVYLLKSCILLLAGLLMVQGMSEVIKAVQRQWGVVEDDEAHQAAQHGIAGDIIGNAARHGNKHHEGHHIAMGKTHKHHKRND
ncbi:MAG: TRAP transporter small permease subunit [Pseudohongiellaceae bacterium]